MLYRNVGENPFPEKLSNPCLSDLEPCSLKRS